MKQPRYSALQEANERAQAQAKETLDLPRSGGSIEGLLLLGWARGVEQSIKAIEAQLATLRSFNTEAARAKPAAIWALEEALIHLQALYERGPTTATTPLDR